MIDKKYIELINLSLDNEITDEQKVELEEYISINEHGRNYYYQLLNINSELNKPIDAVPSENIKKLVMNSIDPSRYSSKETRSFLKFVTDLFELLDKKLVLSFSAGAAVVALIFLFAGNFELSNNEINSLSGSLAPSNELLLLNTEDIIVESGRVEGKITKRTFESSVNFEVRLNASGENTLEINFNPNQYKFSEILSDNSAKLNFDLDAGSLILTLNGKSDFELILEQKLQYLMESEISVNLNQEKL